MVLPDIKSYLKNKTILITGATGFIGKVLVEKLLRDCSDLKLICIILRDKNSVTSAERLDSFKKNEIFKNIDKNLLNQKLKLISGDLTKSNLNLTEENVKFIIENVNIVIHGGASVRFNDSLKTAIQLNSKGTYEMLVLAEKIYILNSFIYISTAFSNTNQKIIKEKIYKSLFEWKFVFDAVDRNDGKILKFIEKRIFKELPNTYVFSKNLSENIVYDFRTKIPVAIMRPSIVCPSYSEPFPGWVDSLNGPIGVLLGASAGILRTVHGSGKIVTDLIPVDFMANSTISAAVHVANNSETLSECRIYNCTTSSDIPITWNEFLDLGRSIYNDYPSTRILWYPGGRMHEYYITHLICFLLTQLIPAFVYDGYRILLGKKPILIKLQKRIFNSLNVIDYFLNNQWKWENSNFHLLNNEMKPTDRYKFNFNMNNLDYKDYLTKWIVGARYFIMKLDPNSIPEAKRKLKLYYWIDFVVKAIIYLMLFYFLFYFLNLSGHSKVIPSVIFGECKTCKKFNLKF